MTTDIRYRLILCDQLSVVQTLHSLNDTELYNTGVGSPDRLYQLNELKREVLMLSTLHHPNILQLIGMVVNDVSNEPEYIVTELATDNLQVCVLLLNDCVHSEVVGCRS